MKYEILKDFPGSQDGSVTENFKAGTIVELSDYLAAAIDPSCARPVQERPAESKPAPTPKAQSIANKAITSTGKGGKGGKK